MRFQMRPEGILQEYLAFRWLNIPSAMAVELPYEGQYAALWERAVACPLQLLVALLTASGRMCLPDNKSVLLVWLTYTGTLEPDVPL